LLDLGARRIADMEEAGIGIQVLWSVSPGADRLPAADLPRATKERIAHGNARMKLQARTGSQTTGCPRRRPPRARPRPS